MKSKSCLLSVKSFNLLLVAIAAIKASAVFMEESSVFIHYLN